ncbi:MAG: hypothetical protein ACR2P2_22525 [Nakamurella sp.]
MVAICLFGAFAAVTSFFYLPLHIGRWPFPVAILGIGWLCWASPRAVHRLTYSLPAAFAPVLVIFVVTTVLLVLPHQLSGLPVRDVVGNGGCLCCWERLPWPEPARWGCSGVT